MTHVFHGMLWGPVVHRWSNVQCLENSRVVLDGEWCRTGQGSGESIIIFSSQMCMHGTQLAVIAVACCWLQSGGVGTTHARDEAEAVRGNRSTWLNCQEVIDNSPDDLLPCLAHRVSSS